MTRKHRHSKARCKSLIATRISRNVAKGKSRKQAVAIALSKARKAGCRIPERKRR